MVEACFQFHHLYLLQVGGVPFWSYAENISSSLPELILTYDFDFLLFFKFLFSSIESENLINVSVRLY